MRLVEMQLTAKPAPADPWADNEFQARESQSATMREYEARRCHICQCKYPSFGFGPPLTRPGLVLWACGAHREQVDRSLTSTATKLEEKPQPSFF